MDVHFERKFKIRRAWKDAFTTARFILAEYHSGRFYRAYQPFSTAHRTGTQIITALLFFASYDAMTDYIGQHNLPTELYHTYTAHQLTPTCFRLTDYKIRYNNAENTGYLTLPIENRAIKGTTLHVGDTVNFSLTDQTTNQTHHIALHKILAKEHNYCTIRLTPTATQYFVDYYDLNQYPVLATGNIPLQIEKVHLGTHLFSKRYAHVNLAKPALLEHLFHQPLFLHSLLKKFGYSTILTADINFMPDGKNRPDVLIRAVKNAIPIQVIGECKACNKQFSHQVIKQATIQLLHYKSLNKFTKAHEGLIIITGNPPKPEWNQLSARIQKLAQKKSSTKYRLYAKNLMSEKTISLFQLKDWYENHVSCITSKLMHQTLLEIKDRHQVHFEESVLAFIEQ